MDNYENIDDQPLSDDPEENLRMENELLRLKLQAELGAKSHTSPGLDPEIENEFLKHVMAFEQNYAKSALVSVYERIGKPDFANADALDDAAITIALKNVIDILFKNNIEVDFSGEYDDRTKYNFIVNELFGQEIDDFSMPGMITHYNYEEFHPNHQLDIETRAEEFIASWFKRDIKENHWSLADSFILPDRQILDKAKVVRGIGQIFEAYTAFTDQKYIIKETHFELNESGGLGNARGLAKYNAVLENGETVTFNGPFIFYMSFEHGWWSIFHIVFPGFKY